MWQVTWEEKKKKIKGKQDKEIREKWEYNLINLFHLIPTPLLHEFFTPENVNK